MQKGNRQTALSGFQIVEPAPARLVVPYQYAKSTRTDSPTEEPWLTSDAEFDKLTLNCVVQTALADGTLECIPARVAGQQFFTRYPSPGTPSSPARSDLSNAHAINRIKGITRVPPDRRHFTMWSVLHFLACKSCPDHTPLHAQ